MEYINDDICALYLQTRRMSYVPENLKYCRYVCKGNKEDCINEDYEIHYRAIRDTQMPFRKGGLAIVVMKGND